MYMFNTIFIKIPMTFFIEIEKSILRVIWKYKRPWIAKAILKKKFKAGGISISNFKLYYRAIIIKTSWYWNKHRYENQWSRIDDPDINPCNHSQLIFDKRIKNTQWRKDSFFHKCFWEDWIAPCRKVKLGPYLSPCINIHHLFLT
jgi:hypothetical protein